MAEQLNVHQLEKIASALPETGNGDWTVRQKVYAARSPGTLRSSVSEVLIIGPGDKVVGQWVRSNPNTYRPHGGVSYWHIRQMEDAGWEETDDIIEAIAKGNA